MSRLIFPFFVLVCISCSSKSESTESSSDSTLVTDESGDSYDTLAEEAEESEMAGEYEAYDDGIEGDSESASDDEGSYDESTQYPFGRPPVSVFSKFEFRGFSPDMRYAGFFSRLDGETLDVIYVIVDIDKNEYVLPTVRFGRYWSTSEDAEVRERDDAEVRKLDSLKALEGEALMVKYKINKGNLGTQVLLDSTKTENDFIINGVKYTLRLTGYSDLILLHENGETVLQNFDQEFRDLRMIRLYNKGNKIAVIVSFVEQCTNPRTAEDPYTCSVGYEIATAALK